MKSKIIKIQEILTKGIAIALVGMFSFTPIAFAATSLDDSYLEGSFLDKILYGTIGSTAKEIEEYLVDHSTLYISNETQLRALAEYVNSGKDCQGKEIILLNDIIVDSSQEWVPIGNISHTFQGMFDGKGYTISGINFNRNNKLYSEISYVGLFGCLYNATIKNITLSNSKFNIPYDVSNDIESYDGNFHGKYRVLGGIAGSNTAGTIENCTIKDDVEIIGLDYVGGIVGSNNYGTILNCSNDGFISGMGAVAGIAGGNYGDIGTNINDKNIIDFSNNAVAKIINCTNKENANIQVFIGPAGGIVGSSINNAIIQKSKNHGSISHITTEKVSINIDGTIVEYNPQNIGGIAGIISGGTKTENDTRSHNGYVAIDGCVNYFDAKVKGYIDVGGIVGQLGGAAGGYAILSNCINYSTDINVLTEGKEDKERSTERGYLAGELTEKGPDGEEGTDDDSISIVYNNLYFTKQDEDEIINEMKYGYQSAYGNVNIEDNYFEQGTSIIKEDDDNENAIVEWGVMGSGGISYIKIKDYNFNGDTYKSICAEEKSSTYKELSDSGISVYINNDYIYKYDENIDAFNLNSNYEQILDKEITVTYSISKKDSGKNIYNIVNGNTYFKSGDEIKIVATINKALCSSWIPKKGITSGMDLKLNSSIEATSTNYNISVSGDNSEITYIYKITDDTENVKIETLNLRKTGTMYVSNGDTYRTITGTKNISSDVANTNLYIDTEKPVINTKVYVENALETGRYTAGKEVLIEITTSEAIQGTDAPRIQVSFSKSGVGKYNYDAKTETVGYAKCKDAKINVAGTTTWSYLYQIQEGDEGDLQLEYKSGTIIDLAGNETDIKALYTPSTENPSRPITGTEWSNDLGVTYEFYKNSVSEENKITSQTYFTDEDDLIVVATYDKVLYVLYANVNKEDKCIPFSSSYVTNLPSLYLNRDGNLKSKATSISSKNEIKESKQTKVTYKFEDIAKNEYLNELTLLSKVVLKNENNTTNIQAGGGTHTLGGQILYSSEYYESYSDENISNLKIINKNYIKTTSDLDNIIIDPIGVSNKIEQDNIYADTTAPTVTITANKENPTNADLIKYTFKFSEGVEGFTADDITVNNGIKVTEILGEGEEANEKVKFVEVEEGKEYTLEVNPTIPVGNEGILQVIIEQNAVQDLVGHGNVRAENVIKVDKKAPTVEITADKEYVQIGEEITYTFNWSEAVKDFDKTKVTVKNADIVTEGEEAKFEKINDSQYTLKVTPTNGNDVEVSVSGGACTDIAGNANIGNKYIIVVVPTLTITTDTSNPTNKSEVTYTFTWSEAVKGFTSEDIVVNNKATKGSLSDVIENEDGTYSYTMTVNYNTVIPAGNEGEVTVYVPEKAAEDVNGNENAYISNTTKIDRISPILLSLEAHATSDISVNENVDTVKEYYKVGDIVKVVATFSENIESTTKVPTLALQFSESGNAKGTVSTGEKSGNKITYTYTITAEDMGTLSVKGFTGTVLDTAGNETIVTKRNLNGDTIIADTKAPTLVGITAIAPNFEYDELLQDGETKRYGVQSKTRTENTITIIAEYSENVYDLSSNTINKIIDNTDPVLKLKFGTGITRTAKYYKTEGSKIYYTYNIASGDNGDLSIVSLSGTVSDIAGNTCTTSTSLPTLVKYEESIAEENKVNNITTDTTNPIFTIKDTAKDYDDNGNEITGNKISTTGYYRKGSVITIKAETNEYIYKNSNKELTRFVENGSDAPQLNISFSTNGNGVGTCANVEYVNNQTIFTYTYEVKENDNGTLNLNIAASQGYDIALNGNNVKTQSISNIIADTVNPVTNWQSWVESEQYGIVDNQNGTWTVTFSEILYVYDSANHKVGNQLTNSNKTSAPILLVSSDNQTALETTISNITTSGNKTVITYTYSPYTRNIGAYGMKFANVSDKAGNLFNYKDQKAPTLSSIEVTEPISGTYKAGQEITIVATFSEKVTGITPTLALQFSESGDAKGNVSNGVIAENTITYTYTIKDGDNGKLSIKSFTGTGLKDLSDNLWVAPTSVTLTGNEIIADTIAPTLTITSDVERTNKDVVTYTFTWSEKVTGFTVEDIEVTNGLKGTFTGENGRNVYTLEVDTTNEGRQIVKVNANVCTDIAGNANAQRATYNQVVIDYTQPEVRAKVNGGNYVLDNTDPENKKSTLKETIVVDEELSSMQYVWSSSETIPEAGWVSEDVSTILVNSDMNLTKEVKETGTYYLYIKAIDIAGNTLEAKTKAFVVKTSQITLTQDKTEITNQDVTVTVEYGEGLTENRKAGVSGLTQSADSNKVVIAENGTVYAEATDKAGNKVCKVLEIENIDKIAPEGTITYVTNEDKSVTATISFNEENVTITNNNGKNDYVFEENGKFTFEFRDVAGNINKATAVVTSIDKTAPEATINYITNEDGSITAKISFNEETVITNNEGKDTYVFTKNGEFTFEFKDLAGNTGTAVAKVTTIKEQDEPVGPPVEEDKTAPEITFNYTTTTSTVGTIIGATITTNEDAIISYSWDNKTWISTEDYVRNINVKKNPTTAGTYTLYAKAIDKASNTSSVSTLAFTVVKSDEDIVRPEIIFEDLTTIQKDGVKYVKVTPTFTTDELTSKMDIAALLGYKVTYEKLTSDNKLKTGSEIIVNGTTKYTVIVNGDVNCDGKVDFLNDIVMVNDYRLGRVKLNDIQVLAGDINNSGTIEFIPDIVAMNNYRLGRIKVL